MGLDTSHGCWHGAYSAFTRWRNKLAEIAGYEVCDNQYPDGSTWPGPRVVADADKSGRFTYENFQGDWDVPPDDPLMILLAHSDWDGHIEPVHAGFLAERLERLIPLLPAEPALGHIGDWRCKTQAFVDGLRAAAEAGERVDFH